jgi:lipoprotein signal peptidase
MHYPAFNVADIAICTAVGLILLYEFFFKKKQEQNLEQNQN